MLPTRLLLFCSGSFRLVTALTFNLTNFNGQLANGSEVLRSLTPTSNPGFDFSINDVFDSRNGNGNYHTGDVLLSWRSSNESEWANATTATNRSITPIPLPALGSAISTSDLSHVFTGSGLNVTKTWSGHDGDLVLSFNLTNTAHKAVEVGGLGFPVEISNILTNRQPAAARQQCSFMDPYIGLDAGYAQVTRLSGNRPNMVVTPFISGTKFEAWEFLKEYTGAPLYYQSTSYEGNYAWIVHSKAYADGEWANATPWNEPTSLSLKPGQTASFGLRFTVVPEVTDIEDTLNRLGFPVAVGIPGYILSRDLVGRMYLNSKSSPASIEILPKGAVKIAKLSDASAKPWIGYSVMPQKSTFGRVRVTVTYADKSSQVLHYWITEDSTTAMDKLGQHFYNKQWYTNTSDPFHRGPSIIAYDKETDNFVLQDNRTWIAGLSDEGGAGSFVTFAMKQIISPVAEEVKRLETFVKDTVWNYLQSPSGNDTYGVKRSMFYYDPSIPDYTYDAFFNWTGAWNQSYAYETNRAYDYVWVSLLYWALYKADRVTPGVLTEQQPTWYLRQAYETVNFGLSNNTKGVPNTEYANAGLMGESTWGHLLEDLRNENMTSEANRLESIFRIRQKYWSEQADPFGSEQPWDCTGQEGVYYWSEYFNDTATAVKTVNSIHGFDPTIPHWGYNGNARRYWDFTTAGNPNTSRIERQIHHYGSSLNSIPLLDYYRRNNTPSSLDSLYNLRVGYGGHMASQSNIDRDGFGSMAFHGFPETLNWDTYTGDYGPSFVGHYQSSASYLVKHPDFGWTAFGGNVKSQSANKVTVSPRDTLRRRVYVAPLGLYVVFEAGQIQSYTWNESQKVFDLSVGPDAGKAQDVIMWFEQTSSVVKPGGVVLATKGLTPSRGGHIVKISKGGKTSLSWTVG